MRILISYCLCLSWHIASTLYIPVCFVSRIVEKYMEKVCNINLVPDVSSVTGIDAWVKQAAADLKVWGVPYKQE